MKAVLVGSSAASYHFADFREVKDWDYLVDGKTPDNLKHAECHDANLGVGLRKIYDEAPLRGKVEGYIATPEQLYTLKLSHCFWDKVHWRKTMHDILFFQYNNVQYNEELFDLLYKDWTKIHGKKRAYLKAENDEFFAKDAVKRTYVHDDIHRAIAYYDRPMFEKIKKNIDLAMIDRGMFEALPYEEQLKVCREEIYVTALERFLIPQNWQIARLTAYMGACRLLMTSMTKGFFPKFIATHWKDLHRPDDHDFVGLFRKWSKK